MENDEIVKQTYRVIIPDKWDIPIESTKIHGITPEFAKREGVPLCDAMAEFLSETADWWVTVIVVISHLLGWIGIASLFDQRQERLNPPQDAQSEEHQRF